MQYFFKYSFWKVKSNGTYQSFDIMVSPNISKKFSKLMNIMNVSHEIIINDVEELIVKENPTIREEGFGWTRYHNIEEIYNWMESLGEKYPKVVCLQIDI